MLLRRMSLSNIGIYGKADAEADVFNLEPRPGKPVVLYGGMNGAGKTTLFDAVSLCMYGRDSIEPRPSKKEYEHKIWCLMHRDKTGKRSHTASATLDFSYSHGGRVADYRIRREWFGDQGRLEEELIMSKKSSGRYRTIMLEGNPQHMINSLLPRSITRLFFFDGEKIQDIADTGNEDEYIASSFNSLLGMDLVDRLHQDMGLHILRTADHGAGALMKEINCMMVEKRNIEKKIEDLRTKATFLEGDVSRASRALAARKDEFFKLGGGMAQKSQNLVAQKAHTEQKIKMVRKGIQDLCVGTMPLLLVPELLSQVKIGLKSEMSSMRSSISRSILDLEFEAVATALDVDLSQRLMEPEARLVVVRAARDIMTKRLALLPKHKRQTFGFSLEDADSLIRIMNSLQRERNFDDLARDYDSLTESLGEIQTMLDASPQHDDIGPVLSAMNEAQSEMAEIERDLESVRALESRESSRLLLLNAKIRKILAEKKTADRDAGGLHMARKVQKVLDDYGRNLRAKKIGTLESNILNGIQRLFHKKDLVNSISIDPNTFKVTLHGSGGRIAREMLSKGELQMYAIAIIWGLARTSGRPLPFIIDTPLARLDTSHRDSMVENFYTSASHQIIILSTNTEIAGSYYERLTPHVARSGVIEYDLQAGTTHIRSGYFGTEKSN